MKVVIHCKKLGWHQRYLEFFRQGFKKHGIAIEATDRETTVPCDVAVLFGPNYWKQIERTHPQYLMVNRKFLGDVNDNVALSWNGFNGRGQFCVDDVNATRLRRHSFDLEPWRKDKTGVSVLCGQFDLGRCGRYQSIQQWYKDVQLTLNTTIFFRKWPGDRPLVRDCANAESAITLNSTVAIETVLLGIPTIACDEGNPAWPICAHHIGHIRRSDNRLAWLEYLANCQWHHMQIANGDFWRQLWPPRGPRLCDVEFPDS
jgi:hypothetical protein